MNDDDFADFIGKCVAAGIFAALVVAALYLGLTTDDIGQFH